MESSANVGHMLGASFLLVGAVGKDGSAQMDFAFARAFATSGCSLDGI